MLTHGEDVEAHALRSRGWTISAIARHLGRDRKTVRAYINGDRVPGVRARSAPDLLEPFKKYLAARFVDDPHVWASALYDEVRRLGYQLSYPSFARQVRLAGLRPHCEACAGVKGLNIIEIDHPAGVEIQWDWFERRSAPWGATAYVLLGTLPHSSKVRGVLAEKMDQPHLIEAIDKVLRCLGGTAKGAAHRPPGHGDRAGDERRPTVLRSGGQALRGCGRALSAPAWQPKGRGGVLGALRLGAVVAHHGSKRHRRRPSALWMCSAPPPVTSAPVEDQTVRKLTVGELADGEPLLALPPVPFPATTEVSRVVADNASVAFGGNRYSVPPGLSGTTLLVRHRLGISHHRRGGSVGGDLGHPSPRSGWIRCTGAQPGSTKRPSKRPCSAHSPRPGRATRRRTVRREREALEEAARLLGPIGREPVVDLSVYGEIAQGQR